MKKTISFVLAVLLILPCFAVFPFLASATEEKIQPSVYLSDMTPTSYTVAESTLCNDTNLEGATLSLNNAGNRITFSKGVCVHAIAEVNYDISGIEAIGFSAVVGMDDGSYGYKDYAGADFAVYADGQLLVQCPTLRLASAAYSINVDIPKGTKTLTIKNGHGDDGSTWSEHCVWGDAKVLTDPNSEGEISSLTVSASMALLEVGDESQITSKVVSVNGVVVDNSKITWEYTSSDSNVVTVSRAGVVSAVGEGSAAVTVKATKSGKTLTKTLNFETVSENSQTAFLLVSPDGSLQILLKNTNSGLTYKVYKNSTLVVEESTIGHKTTTVDFTNGFTFVNKTELEYVNDTYKNYSGDYDYGHDEYNGQSYKFSVGEYYYTVTMRAYEDGYALRSSISRADGQSDQLTVTDDKTSVRFPDGTYIWGSQLADRELLRGNSYESGFPKISIKSAQGKNIMKAALAEVADGMFVLISEADLYTSPYIGSIFRGIGNNTLEYAPAPQKTINDSFTSAMLDALSQSELKERIAALDVVDITLSPEFVFPWRYGVVGDAATIVESDLTENLNPRTTEDFSWVETGFTTWMWLSEGFGGQRDEKTIKEYIDLAASLGWKYLILDEGWQPNAPYGSGKVYDGYFDYFHGLVKYAESKGVGFIAWVKLCDLDTPEEREVLREWAQIGIKGIKFDFVESESVQVLQDVKAIYDICAQEHLLVNEHGGNVPTGERSTWPNVINRESVKGQEYGALYCSDSTVWTFTRAAIGPTDVTPKIEASGTCTAAHQLALLTVVESGMPCVASDTLVYDNCNFKSLLKKLPTAWDELRYIDGYPGDKTILARRKGNEWFVGGITYSKSTVTLGFDFLDEGTQYYAVIYKDGTSRNDVAVASTYVTKDSTIDISMLDGGGFTVSLTRASDVVVPSDIIFTSNVVDIQIGKSETLQYTLVPADSSEFEIVYSSSDPSVATVSSIGVVTGYSMGVTSITASIPEIGLSKEITVRVYNGSELDINHVWTIVNQDKTNPIKFFEDDHNSLMMPILLGNTNLDVKDMLLTERPGNDYTITLKVGGGLTSNYESVGIIVYAESGNMVHLSRRFHSYLGNNIFCLSTHNTSTYIEYTSPDTDKDTEAYLKLVVSGNYYTGYFSYDGQTWSMVGTQSLEASRLSSSSLTRIGVGAMSGSSDVSKKSIKVSDFTLNGQLIPFMKEPYISLSEGKTQQYVAGQILAGKDFSDLVYTVDNPNIASVDENGVIIARKSGITTLRATDPSSGEYTQIELRIVKKAIAWETVNPDNSKPIVVVDGDTVRMPILAGSETSGTIKNIMLTKVEREDFELIVKVSGGLTSNFESAGIVVYVDSDNFVSLERRSHSYFGGNVFCVTTRNNSTMSEPYVRESKPNADAYLKLVRKGNTFTAFYSYDGVKYTQFAGEITNANVGQLRDVRVGLITRSGVYESTKIATFENFMINGEKASFTATEVYDQIILPEDITVKAGDTLTLPEMLYIYSSLGNKKSVAAQWDTSNVDLSVPGVYTVTVRCGELTDSITVTVELDENLKNGFITEDGKLYYYVNDVKQKGWFIVDGVNYYASLITNAVISERDAVIGTKQYFWNDETGLVLADGFYENEGINTYASIDPTTGVATLVKITTSGTICFEDGYLVYGWRHADGSPISIVDGIYEQYSTNPNNLYYFLSTTFTMVTDETYTIGGWKREFNADHTVKPLSGIQNYYGTLYNYLNGVPQEGWQTVDGNRYYFLEGTGKAASMWTVIDGKLYYFYASTSATPYALKTSGSIGGIDYTYAEDGSITLTGFINQTAANTAGNNTADCIQRIDATTMYFENGERVAEWKMINGNWYYFDIETGYMCTESRTIGGVLYEFTAEGVCKNK